MEYFNGTIKIDSFSKELKPEFDSIIKEAINTENGIDFYHESVSGVIEIASSGISYGRFFEVEKFCIANEIAFDAISGTDYDTSAKFIYYRSGMDKPEERVSGESGEYIIPQDVFDEVIKHINDSTLKEKLLSYKCGYTPI